MKKLAILLFSILLLFGSTKTIVAAPTPVRQVEVFRKPGVNFSQFKSVGDEMIVSIRPVGASFFDNSDPFLRQRIKKMTIQAAKRQGWAPTDNSSADVRLSVKITEWGRFRNNYDQNLMEFLAIEVKAYSRESGEMVLRAAGRYSRVDPVEESMNAMDAEFVSLMAEILTALKTND